MCGVRKIGVTNLKFLFGVVLVEEIIKGVVIRKVDLRI